MDEKVFAYIINCYMDHFNSLVNNNGLPREMEITPNEVVSALSFYTDFDDEELNTLLCLIDKGNKSLKDTVWENLQSFIFKTRLLERLQKTYNDSFYRDLIVKENNYDDFNIVDYPKLRDNVMKVNMIKKYGKRYEDYRDVLDSIVENGDRISSSYYNLLWDIGLNNCLYDTKYEDFYNFKVRLNRVYKSHMIDLATYDYKGEHLLEDSEGKKFYEFGQETINCLEELDKKKREKKGKTYTKDNK